MFDRRARELCQPVLIGASGQLSRLGVRANTLTGIGWLAGVGACVAVGFRLWTLALLAWLLNRFIDGLDGALARRRGVTDLGGYLDLLCDFSVYAGFVVALAIALPATRLASVTLLFSYYLSGTALLAASALLDRRGIGRVDDRSISLLGGVAEGLETMVAYVAILIAPSSAQWVEWTFTFMVLLTVVQRVVWTRRVLRGAMTSVRPDDTQRVVAP